MADWLTADQILNLGGLLTPGIIILWVRGRFRSGGETDLSEKFFNYAVVSVAYNAVAYPLFHAESGWHIVSWLWDFLFRLFLPLLVAIVLVLFDKSDTFYKSTEKLGLRPIHHTPTAWEYTFRNRPPSYALVHLSDGSTVAGSWIDGSFASTKAGDRDLLISEMWTVGDDGAWSIIEPSRAVLICGGNIRMIEFIAGGSA